MIAGEDFEQEAVLALVPYAEKIKLTADGGQATVHGRNVLHLLRGPEALGDGGVAGPDARIDAVGGDVLHPHAGLTAENARLFFDSESGGFVLDGVSGIVIGRGVNQVQILVCRKNA
jgi:hypothetical protein